MVRLLAKELELALSKTLFKAIATHYDLSVSAVWVTLHQEKIRRESKRQTPLLYSS